MSEPVTTSGKIHVMKEDGDAPRATIKNKNTASFNAAVTCGARHPKRFYIDHVEMIEGKPHRTTTWLLDANREVEFRPDFVAERIPVGEAIKRFNDPVWCEANPHHPIAFLHFYASNGARLIDYVKAKKPAKLIRRGKRFVVIEAGCPKDVADKFLEDLNHG